MRSRSPIAAWAALALSLFTFDQAVAEEFVLGAGTKNDSSRLPRHMPPMNVPSRMPSEIDDEPMISCSS